MPDTRTSWADLVKYSEDHDLLAKKLYVVSSTATDGIAPVMENLDPHVEWQTQLEREGVMFAAGPLATDDEQYWEGDGMFVSRADSREAAVALAEKDPMHSSGARSFTVRPWLMNEGTYTVQVFYSGKRAEVV